MAEFQLNDNEKDSLIFSYSPEYGLEFIQAKLGIAWDDDGKLIKYSLATLPDELKNMRPSMQDGFSACIKKVFYFEQDDLIDNLSEMDTMVFQFAHVEAYGDDTYYHIPAKVLDIKQDIFIAADKWMQFDYFATGYERRTSVFKKISKLIATDEMRIIIGGSADDAIPWEDFVKLLREFPTTSILEHYGDKQVASILSDYLTPKTDYEQKYIEAKRRILKKADYAEDNAQIGTQTINKNRCKSFLESRDILSEHLDKDKDDYDETFWQEKILSILPAVYPQYIAVLREVIVPERISKRRDLSNRRLDHLLIDASGNVDILEVKCPFDKNKLLMKRTYRDNYIPAHELNGGISQIEKYIYYLNHLGTAGEEEFSEKCKKRLADNGVQLPDDLKLRFLNPHGILLIGFCDFTSDEQRDFDLIRRQYAHVTDIITYNDLLSRIDRIVNVTS